MTYVPDREINPPSFYDTSPEKVDCALCWEDIEIQEAEEIGDSLHYLCEKCHRDVEDMYDGEKVEFINDHLAGREIFRKLLLTKKNKKNEQK